MLLGGQWIARCQGSNEGILVLDVDEIDDHFEGVAFARDDKIEMPSTAVSFSTTSGLTSQKLDSLPLRAFDYFGRPLSVAQLESHGIQFPTHCNVELKLTQSDELNIAWTTSIGGWGNATAKRSSAGDESALQPLNISNWNEFKNFVTKNLERNSKIITPLPQRTDEAYFRSKRPIAEFGFYKSGSTPTMRSPQRAPGLCRLSDTMELQIAMHSNTVIR